MVQWQFHWTTVSWTVTPIETVPRTITPRTFAPKQSPLNYFHPENRSMDNYPPMIFPPPRQLYHGRFPPRKFSLNNHPWTTTPRQLPHEVILKTIIPGLFRPENYPWMIPPGQLSSGKLPHFYVTFQISQA